MTLFDVGVLFIAALVAFLLAGTLAPLEALGWWAGWFGPAADDSVDADALAEHVEAATEHPDADTWVVFLTGIHTVEGRTFAGRERNFLDRLETRLPHVPVVEVFPYSVTDRPLTGDRVLSRFWRWALSMKLSKRTVAGLAGMVINLRNVWQVAVSADRRYGPIYNRGSADIIAKALLRGGFPPPERAEVGMDVANPSDGPRTGRARPSPTRARPEIVLIGYSGGGQVALGAAGPLQHILGAHVTVVSLGGVMSADPSLRELERLYHLVGEHDRVHQIGNVVFPGRWRILPYSAWQQARQRGAVRIVDMGPPDHTGRRGYLDSKTTLPDGRSYLEQTVDVVAAIVEGRDPRSEAFGERDRAA